jgi:hypothetical protein
MILIFFDGIRRIIPTGEGPEVFVKIHLHQFSNSLDQIMTNLGNPSIASVGLQFPQLLDTEILESMAGERNQVVAIGTSPSFRGLTHMKVTAWII